MSELHIGNKQRETQHRKLQRCKEINPHCRLAVGGVTTERSKQQRTNINAKDGVGAVCSLHVLLLHRSISQDLNKVSIHGGS